MSMEKITLQIWPISKTPGRNVASVTFRTNFPCNQYISLQLDVVDLWYFKLRNLLDPIVLWNIKCLPLHCKEIRKFEFVAKYTITLNPFDIAHWKEDELDGFNLID